MGPTIGKSIVGLITNLGERKKPEYLFEICPEVLKHCPDTEFWVIGGEYGRVDQGRQIFLEQKAVELGLGGSIKFTGYVTDISQAISNIDVGIALTEKEACSRAILEIMSSGKPVVAFDTGGNSELIVNGNTGFIVEFRNFDRFAKSLAMLLKDKNLRSRLGMKAREHVEDFFNVKINAARTEQIYSELI